MLLRQGVPPRIFNADGNFVGRARAVFALQNRLRRLLLLHSDSLEMRPKMYGLRVDSCSIDVQDGLLISHLMIGSSIFVIMLRVVVVLYVDDCL
jgi:hypothetical protein